MGATRGIPTTGQPLLVASNLPNRSSLGFVSFVLSPRLFFFGGGGRSFFGVCFFFFFGGGGGEAVALLLYFLLLSFRGVIFFFFYCYYYFEQGSPAQRWAVLLKYESLFFNVIKRQKENENKTEQNKN